MAKIDTYSAKGTKLESIALPGSFSPEKNLNLLAQAIRVYEERSHIGLASAKTRAEINRTKKKWYKQKGTGGARHGAKSAPIFVGGGSAHGPRPERRVLTLPKAMVKRALFQALSAKIAQKEVVAVSGVEKLTKTTEAAALLTKLGKATKYTFILGEANLSAKKILRNLAGVKVCGFRNLNAYEVFGGGKIILDVAIFTKEKPAVKVTKKVTERKTK
jgi:large subunit ribosomal protein L4